MNDLNLENEEEEYIPQIDDDAPISDIQKQIHRSNVATALDWSSLEEKMFEMLLSKHDVGEDPAIIDELAQNISHLIKTFDIQKIARIMSVAMMSFQLATIENKSFDAEYEKFRDYMRNHPGDWSEI